MDVVKGAFGDEDPQKELRSTLETARSWLEGAIAGWGGLSEQRRLEMIAASLLSMHRIEAVLDDVGLRSGRLRMAEPSAGPIERPNLVDLTLDERQGEATACVKLVYGDEDLVGESACRTGPGRDHAAPARATLDALHAVLKDGLTLEDARVMQIVDGPFAVVTLRSEDRLLVGSAMIEDDLGVAMARATLDAANRFISGIAPQGDRSSQLA